MVDHVLLVNHILGDCRIIIIFYTFVYNIIKQWIVNISHFTSGSRRGNKHEYSSSESTDNEDEVEKEIEGETLIERFRKSKNINKLFSWNRVKTVKMV